MNAWHEAGHALAAHILGGVVREVSLESELDDHEGHVAVEWSTASRLDSARRSATVALAGPMAELVFRGEDVLEDPDLLPGMLAAWRGDWDEAEARLAELHPDEDQREAARRAILQELRELFQSDRGYECLARIADALEAHVTLDEGLFFNAVEALA